MNCPYCGTSNPETASICANCARPLNAPPPPPPPPPPRPMPPGIGQPAMAAHATGATVPNYLVRSIFATLCCCLPLGVVAIIFAAQVNSKLAAGDMQGAMAASESARKLSLVAIIIGLVVILLSIVINGGVAFLQGFTDGFGR